MCNMTNRGHAPVVTGFEGIAPESAFLDAPITGMTDGVVWYITSYVVDAEHGPMPNVEFSTRQPDIAAWVGGNAEYFNRNGAPSMIYAPGWARWTLGAIFEGDAPWNGDWADLGDHLRTVAELHIISEHLGCC